MRGAALSQLGEFASAKAQLRAALRALGPKDGLLRARCLAAEAEIALAVGDLRWSAEPVAHAVAELEAAGDARNAAYLQLVAARAALRLGRPKDAERLLRHAKLVPAAPLQRTFAELVRVELAAKRGNPDLLTSALASAGAAAERAAIPSLVAEVARIRDHYEGPTSVITSRGKARTASFIDVSRLGRSADVIIDGGGLEVRSSGEHITFARKPVLFEVLRVLAEAWPDAVSRDALIARAFGARRPNESHRIRLRVEIGRLRKIVRPRLGVVAQAPGYALSATGEVVLVMPLEESPASRLLSLMHGGEAWSASSLAFALDVSERTVQRSLGELQSAGKVGPTGNGRVRRWVRLFEIPTDLLLPPRPPAH
jgi:tetratricopeptide (TPR) repeat protein